MVHPLLAGTKTQTRRIVKAPSEEPVEEWRTDDHGSWYGVALLTASGGLGVPVTDIIACPYGKPGDRLWVRETFTHITGNGIRVHYRADGEPTDRDGCALPTEPGLRRWSPSIHMPRAISRITLEIAEVRVERLQAISSDDARDEGITDEDTRCDGECGATPCSMLVPAYQRLWCAINGAGSWDANPWVWALTFRRI
jgi:hypothetical protein